MVGINALPVYQWRTLCVGYLRPDRSDVRRSLSNEAAGLCAGRSLALILGACLRHLLGFASHAPGAIGALDAAMLIGLPGFDPAALIATLLLYRLLYFVAPSGWRSPASGRARRISTSAGETLFAHIRDAWRVSVGAALVAALMVIAAGATRGCKQCSASRSRRRCLGH